MGPPSDMNRTDRYKEIQLPQLRSFCVVATEGNFTAAARRLGLSTPTVWQQVRALETHLKTTLIRRRGRVVELTDEGGSSSTSSSRTSAGSIRWSHSLPRGSCSCRRS